MATRVTVEGQVTLPKAVRDAAGIRPSDLVTVRALAEGGVIVERETAPDETASFLARLETIAERKPMEDGRSARTRPTRS
jgi:antitoxin PrlF